MDRSDAVGSDPSSPTDARSWRWRVSGPRIFAVAFIVFFGAGAVWSAMVPLLGAPDEPSHIVKAAAVARGEWTAQCFDFSAAAGMCVPAPQSALGLVTLPSFYALVRAPDATDPANSQICFHAKATVPASCARSLNRSPSAYDIAHGVNKYAWTYAARYPPLYYFVVGLPSYFGGSTIDLYLMRLVSAAISAIFLALAFTAALVYSRNRMLLVGLLVAATPMVFFLDGAVNPSGLEIAAAAATWTTGAILVTERLASPPPGLVAMLGASAVVFELIRSLSPVWLGLCVVSLLACADRRAVWSALGRRSVQLCIVVVAIFGIAAVWWIVAVHATDVYASATAGIPATTSTSKMVLETFRHNVYWLPTMIGIFGWYDAHAPLFTYVLWYGFIGLLLGAALYFGGLRHRVVLVLLGAAILLVPTAISASHARTYGYLWSGRDTMPLAIGLPILAAALLGTSQRLRVPSWFARFGVAGLAVLAGVAQFGGFFAALRRWAVGIDGPSLSFITHPLWHPAIGIIPALVLEVVALVALGTLFVCAWRSPILPSARAERVEDTDEVVARSSVAAAFSIEGA